MACVPSQPLEKAVPTPLYPRTLASSRQHCSLSSPLFLAYSARKYARFHLEQSPRVSRSLMIILSLLTPCLALPLRLNSAPILQQTLLVGAGVTSLELRKAGCTPYNPKEKRRSTDRSLDRSAQSKNSLPPLNGAGRRRGLVLFPSRREFFGNWADFLRGNEVSSTA